MIHIRLLHLLTLGQRVPLLTALTAAAVIPLVLLVLTGRARWQLGIMKVMDEPEVAEDEMDNLLRDDERAAGRDTGRPRGAVPARLDHLASGAGTAGGLHRVSRVTAAQAIRSAAGR